MTDTAAAILAAYHNARCLRDSHWDNWKRTKAMYISAIDNHDFDIAESLEIECKNLWEFYVHQLGIATGLAEALYIMGIEV